MGAEFIVAVAGAKRVSITDAFVSTWAFSWLALRNAMPARHAIASPALNFKPFSDLTLVLNTGGASTDSTSMAEYLCMFLH